MIDIVLPAIKTTMPGEEYRLGVDQNQICESRLFRSRYELASHCKSLLGHCEAICELGVWDGDFSVVLHELFSPSQMYLVDTCDRAAGRLPYPGVKFLKGLSWDMLATLPDRCLDFIYIDAGHSYEAVSRDISQSHRKVKAGGIMQFNDYCTYSVSEGVPYGVLDAVNSYIENYDIQIVGMSLERSGYHDLAIRHGGICS